MALPGRGAYIASKAAIEGLHESLKKEVEELGIKVLIVQPGSFRTSWTAHAKSPAAYESSMSFSEGYKGTVVERWVGMANNIKNTPLPDVIKGDPDKAAREIVRAVVEGHDYFRLLLGPDCAAAAEQKLGELGHDLEATREIAMSTNGEI